MKNQAVQFANSRTGYCNYLKACVPPHGENYVPLFRCGVPSFLPTCFWVLASESVGNCVIQQEHKPSVAAAIRMGWDEQTSLFSPGNIRQQDLANHSPAYLRLQATYFAIHALDSLGERIPERLEFAKLLSNTDFAVGWIAGGRWENPWLQSNNVMFALSFLQTEHQWFDNQQALLSYDAILDYLDTRQDPTTGLWHSEFGGDIPNAVYAAYHFFPFYFWRKRRPDFINQIINSVLSIQSEDGLFGGGACEDLDAAHTLIMMSMVSEYRKSEVMDRLHICRERLLQLQNPDGGFPNYLAWDTQKKGWKRKLAERSGAIHILPARMKKRGLSAHATWKYSGWTELECPRGVSDLWGTWFRFATASLITSRLDDGGTTWSHNSRKLPGLAWHDEQKILESVPAT
jgi:hypothetical protein